MTLNENQKFENDDSSWIISYGDMVTLLLAFFIILFTLQDSINSKVDQNKLQNAAFEIASPIQNQFNETIISTKIEDEQIIVEFPNTSFFDSGNTKILANAATLLNSFADSYLPYSGNYTLHVVGFTDNTPVRELDRPFKDNLELSVLRAVEAQRILQKQGIPLIKMRLAGYGISDLYSKKITGSSKAAARKIMLILDPLRKKRT